MAHASARLTVFSRQLLVKRVLVDGWPTATVAEQLGISRATAYKWVRRYRTDGLPGLEDRSSRPHRSPRRSSDEVTATILRARARRRYGPARLAPLTGHPRSTIYGVLRRAGLNRLRDTDPELFARYILDRLGTSQRAMHAEIARRLAAGQTTGAVRGGDPVRLAAMVLLVTQSAVQSAPLVAEWLPADAWRAELGAALRGYLAPEPR